MGKNYPVLVWGKYAQIIDGFLFPSFGNGVNFRSSPSGCMCMFFRMKVCFGNGARNNMMLTT